MNQKRYPIREAYFSHRFCRLLTKAAVAQEISPESCWLLTVIAHQEDAKRYRGPVTYYNGQLMPLCGFASEGRLIRARDRAVKAGWLYYRAGGKRKPGIYWCTIPTDYERVPDSPNDEGTPSDFHLQNGSESEGGNSFHVQNGRESEGKAKGNRSANGGPSTLVPSPSPKAGCDDRLLKRWCSGLGSDELKDPRKGMARFQQAVEQGFVRSEDRHRFISLWLNTNRKASKGQIKNGAACFVRNLKLALGGGEWFGDGTSDDEASEFLRQWDRQHGGPVNPVVANVAQALADDTPEEVFDDE